MRKETQQLLLGRAVASLDAGAPEPECSEGSIDVERYVSTSRLDDERRVLFRKYPLVVAHESELPAPGAFVARDVSGTPVLVTRGQDGVVRAMLNVCRHRGTRLVNEPCGTAKAFVCRYHAWTYALDGALGHVPQPECFTTLDKKESGLVALPCEVRHGFVWVVPTPPPAGHHEARSTAIDVAKMLGKIDEDLAAFGLDRHVVFQRSTSVRKANWKLVMDAFLEGYHVKSLHQRTLSRFFHDKGVVFDAIGDHMRSVGPRRNLLDVKDGPRDGWDVRDLATVFYTVFPNTVIVFHPETVSHIALYPRAIDEVDFVHTMLAPHVPQMKDGRDEERAAWQKTWELIDGKVFGEEDLMIAESIQSCLGSGANTRFPLGALERPIRIFHDAMDRAIARG